MCRAPDRTPATDFPFLKVKANADDARFHARAKELCPPWQRAKVEPRFLVTGVDIRCVGPNEDVYFGDGGFVIDMPAFTGKLC